ncbi:MAG: hypothetical protein COB04_01635 [Gammaproteobacteria bacterium]|nr:MAG: hypothetical protein COB04_01635 [Gammaproteobacteria bacterium]
MDNSTSNQSPNRAPSAHLNANLNQSDEERFNFARSLHFKGEFDQAKRIYLDLQKVQSWPQLSELLGILHLQCERYQEAIEHFKICDEKDYSNADLLFNYGKCYSALGGMEKALELYERALILDPQHSNSIYNLANLYKSIDDFKRARDYFQKDLQLHPKVDTCCALGEIYERDKKLPEALELYYQGLALEPDNPLPKLRISIALQKKNTSAPIIDFSEFNIIFKFCREVLEEFPENAICYALIGDMYLLLGNINESMSHMRKSIALDASFATSHTALGCQLLMTGQFEEGFEEFYWHSQVTEYDTGTVARSVAGSTKNEWSGEVYAGMQLLVTSEQGIGDQILHFHCLPGLIAKGVRLVISVNYKLVPLFVRSFPSVEVYPDCYPIPDAVEEQVDFQTSVLGLTQFIVRTMDDIIGVPSYLQACKEKTAQFAARYVQYDHCLKVGISWSSNSTSTGTAKTIPLDWWHDLLAIEGVQFVSLQYGGVGVEVEQVNTQYGTNLIIDREINITEDQDGFSAMLKNLDLVITISNATAHLCGALGVNTWVVLSPAPLWHWFYGLDHSLWYPSVSLIRRAPHDHWKDVLNRIGVVLPLLASNKSSGIDLFDGVPEHFTPKKV